MDKHLRAALIVLFDAKEPLNAIEIIDIAVKNKILIVTGETPDESLGSQIYVDMKKKNEKSFFIKTSPGKFIINPFMRDELAKIIPDLKKQEVKDPKEEIQKYKSYSLEDLELIFSLPPTKENCKKLAKVLGRTEHAIEQQYQWAMLSDTLLKEKGFESKKNMPCRDVSKKMGWIRTY